MTADKKMAGWRLLKELDELRSRLHLLKDAETKISDAQRAIASSEKFNRSILDSLDANIAVIDSEGTIINVNDSWIRFALENGVSSLDKVEAGVNYFEVCREAHGPHSKEAPIALDGLQSLLSGDRSHFELEYPCDSPEIRRWYLMKAARMEIDGQRGIIVSHVDITTRKLAEEAILRSNEILEEEVEARTRDLERAKSEAELYLDIMSHDLSNINQALLGYLELALDRLDGRDEERDLLTRPLELVQKSSDLIARVKKLRGSGGYEGKLERVDLCQSIADAVQRFSRIPGRHMEINYTPEHGKYVLANDLLPEIFVNIIGNAIKHSDPDKDLKINIKVDMAMAGNKKCYVVKMDDNGPGIPDPYKSTLFEPRSYMFPGRGVGMILVKNLMEMFNGTIEVRDRVPGDFRKGTCFLVRLPAAS